jgi:hypothetical protein
MTQGNIFNSMCIGGNDLPVQILHAGKNDGCVMNSRERNSLFLQRRAMLAGLAGAFILPRMAAAFDVPDEPRLAKHDYAKVRHHFRTKLLQKGPAPDKYEPLNAPADADKIFYRSGYG